MTSRSNVGGIQLGEKFSIYHQRLSYWKSLFFKYLDDNGSKQELDVKQDINEVTRALLSPLRTNGYVFEYIRGKHN